MSHLQLSFQDQGGDQHGHQWRLYIGHGGSGMLTGWRFCFGARDSGGRRL